MNNHVFLTSKPQNINFITARYHKSRSAKSIINTLNEIRQIYKTRGFLVENIHGDNEFNKDEIKRSQLPALFHIYRKDEHVEMIERSNRTVKEKCRTLTHVLPYRHMTKVMTIGLVATATKWLNAFPSKNRISKTMSLSTIIEGMLKPNMKYRHIVFGSHAMVFIGTNNKMDTRSVPAIALNPSNQHDDHYFMSLYSGKQIHSYNWQEIPIDDDVTERIRELAEKEGAPVMETALPTFTWRQRNIVGLYVDKDVAPSEEEESNSVMSEDENSNDIEHDIIYKDDNDDNLIVYSDSDDKLISFDDTDNSQNNDMSIMNEHGDEANVVTYNVEIDVTANDEDILPINNTEIEEEITHLETIAEETNKIEAEVVETQTATDAETNDNATLRRSTREGAGEGVERLEMSLDNNKEYASIRSQNYQLAMTNKVKGLDRGNTLFMNVAANYLFVQVSEHAQMSAKAGIKKFGDKAIASMLSKY